MFQKWISFWVTSCPIESGIAEAFRCFRQQNETMRRKSGLIVGLRIDAVVHTARLVPASRNACKIELQGGCITPGDEATVLIKELLSVPVTAKRQEGEQFEFTVASPLLAAAIMYALAGNPSLASELANSSASSVRNFARLPVGLTEPPIRRSTDDHLELPALRRSRSG